MECKVKRFEELNTAELYEILCVRAEIFVVEQTCVYQDLDGLDQKSFHVFLEEEGKIHGYLRFFELEDGRVKIGRVLTVVHGTGLGATLLKEGIKACRKQFPGRTIYVGAQSYAAGFYAKEGFEVCSEEFLEDGIPHVGMILPPQRSTYSAEPEIPDCGCLYG